MERTYINSLFKDARSLPVEVEISTVNDWVSKQVRTPAGQSGSWIYSLNSILMIGIILTIGAIILGTTMDSASVAENVSSPKKEENKLASVLPVQEDEMELLEDESSLFAIAMVTPEEVQDETPIMTMDIVKRDGQQQV
ncbi:MAG: hypothetical protein AAF193_00620, partial [Bacteroidota bacterium]